MRVFLVALLGFGLHWKLINLPAAMIELGMLCTGISISSDNVGVK